MQCSRQTSLFLIFSLVRRPLGFRVSINLFANHFFHFHIAPTAYNETVRSYDSLHGDDFEGVVGVAKQLNCKNVIN